MIKHIFFILPFFITLILPSFILAHKVRVFAYESSGEIITESKFNNGRPAVNAEIHVKNNSDKTILLTGATDDKGFFRFAIPEIAKSKAMNLDIILDIGEGHKGTWLLSAADYLEDTTTTNNPSPPPRPVTPLSNTEAHEADDINYQQLELLFERIIDKKLEPIKRTLAENSQQKTSLKDIFGGLGYIFGLAGLAAYLQSRKSGDK